MDFRPSCYVSCGVRHEASWKRFAVLKSISLKRLSLDFGEQFRLDNTSSTNLPSRLRFLEKLVFMTLFMEEPFLSFRPWSSGVFDCSPRPAMVVAVAVVSAERSYRLKASRIRLFGLISLCATPDTCKYSRISKISEKCFNASFSGSGPTCWMCSIMVGPSM